MLKRPTTFRFLAAIFIVSVLPGCSALTTRGLDSFTYKNDYLAHDAPVQHGYIYNGYLSGSRTDVKMILFPFFCKESGCEAIFAWPLAIIYGGIGLPFDLFADVFFIKEKHGFAKENNIKTAGMWKASVRLPDDFIEIQMSRDSGFSGPYTEKIVRRYLDKKSSKKKSNLE